MFLTETAKFVPLSGICKYHFDSGCYVVTPKRCFEFYGRTWKLDRTLNRTVEGWLHVNVTNWFAGYQWHVYHRIAMTSEGGFAVFAHRENSDKILDRAVFDTWTAAKAHCRELYK